jgi:tetratricopeptide (TPR) repeat protein
MARADKTSWDTRLRVANMLLAYGQPDQAKELIAELDAVEYFQQAVSEWQANLLLNVLIRSGHPEEAIQLLKKNANRLEESAQINIRIRTASRLLAENSISEAIELISDIDYQKSLLFTETPPSKILLIFLKSILSEKKQLDPCGTRETLCELISSTNQPIVETALAGNAGILMRRMECSCENPLDMKATQWIAEALQIEHKILPFNQKNLTSLSRWMVLAGRVTEILNIMEEIYKSDPSITDGYTYLSIFLWIKGYYKEGLSCLHKERLNNTIDPVVLFARTVSFSIFGTPESTVYWLNILFLTDKKFFAGPNIGTEWGFLVLILKKIGQNSLSHKAQCMAKKHDPYNALRQHLWAKIPLSYCKLQFPCFIMPADFENII